MGNSLNRSLPSPLPKLAALMALCFVGSSPGALHADGKLVKPRDYQGSLEEKAQEAIIIFNGSEQAGESTEDLILKIRVTGQADEFAWIVPFPNKPKVEKEDEALFKELFDYVESRQRRTFKGETAAEGGAKPKTAEAKNDVEVLSREIVGSYDVAVVQENSPGKLNEWLSENGYQPLEKAEDVLTFYRDKGYVYACIRVSDTALGQSQGQPVDLHPLRFTFRTGGRDAMYFPMKLTGLQSEPFDVNLYVFYRFWLNDRLNKFGYAHRGFRLNFRDYDTKQCEPNGGKAYTTPSDDPYLRGYESRLKHTTKLLQKLHPGERYYLTNIQADNLKPADVREWSDDLWLFPYYTNRAFVPYDARPGQAASAAWPNLSITDDGDDANASAAFTVPNEAYWALGGIAGGVLIGFLAARIIKGRDEEVLH